MNQAPKITDLTHTISSDIPTFDGSCGFTMSLAVDYKDCKEPNLFRLQKIETKTGIGTHMDAPVHCFPGAKTIDMIDLNDLVTDCVMIDVSEVADENYVIMPSVVEEFENKHGKIAPNTFVIFYTGWDQFWTTPEKYRNGNISPSVDASTAEMLTSRDIAGLGIDTLSADKGKDDFPVHRIVLGAGKYLVENIANAKALPPTGAKIFVLPMKIKDGTEAPIRLVAQI